MVYRVKKNNFMYGGHEHYRITDSTLLYTQFYLVGHDTRHIRLDVLLYPTIDIL